jgi:SAM-dependent methyltransferase
MTAMQGTGLAGVVACPRCHAPLDLPALPGEPSCASCGATYRWDDGVADLTPLPPPPGLVADRWALWEQLQANGARAYDALPDASLSIGRRTDVRLFGAFAELEGRVLDVGCGPQELPSYGAAADIDFVGIDPLRGVRTRSFTFVRGLGEYLPFADGSFDRVLFATSLDHLLDPARGVREAARVLAPGGRVVIWTADIVVPSLVQRAMAVVGERLPNTRRLRALERAKHPPAPAGAVDAYHFEHPSLDQIRGWLDAAGLRVVDEARLTLPTIGIFLAADRAR